MQPEHSSGAWSRVIDDKIGFHSTSSRRSSFADTNLLENQLEKLQQEKKTLDDKMERAADTLSRPKNDQSRTEDSASDRRRKVQMCLAFQYETEYSRQYVKHRPLKVSPVGKKVRGNNAAGTEPPRAKFSKKGEFVDWVDVCQAEGGLVPIVASSRPGITRML